jgi:OOP family OmpA-OmpF porin
MVWITPEGPAVVQAGLHGLRKAVTSLTGKTAVLMFTDGIVSSGGGKSSLKIAQEIAKDNDVCFYLISSATEDVNVKLLEAVSKINACSRVVPLALFLENPSFYTTALFTVRTTAYVKLTPVTKVVGFTTNDMLFDFDSASIRSEYSEKLALFGDFLQRNPEAYVVAAGYTDGTGDGEYNLLLSQQRAESFKKYIVDNFSIDEARIVPFWFGAFNPVADNGTREGRKLNRRVEIAVELED